MAGWIAVLIQQLLSVITPELRKAVVEFVAQLEKQAKATPNKWDDIFVGLLKAVLVIP
ncbi:MAG: hypothetical protein GY782_01170 [Gammaproteobacteria bacterium]|nr:hypothetical protein [Gammaproteobacteria bacterium]